MYLTYIMYESTHNLLLNKTTISELIHTRIRKRCTITGHKRREIWVNLMDFFWPPIFRSKLIRRLSNKK